MVRGPGGRYVPRSRWTRAATFSPMSYGRDRVRSTVPAAVLTVAAIAACLPPPGPASSGGSSLQASASPASSGAVTRSPRPSPTPKAQELAIAAFVERVASGKLTYRVTFKGTARASADVLPVAGTMDVSGADFATSFTYDFEREYPGLGKERIQVRAVDGAGYIKRGSARWQRIKGFGVAHSYEPFKMVDGADDVTYLGTVEAGDATLYKIGVAGALLIHPNTIPYQVQKEKVDDTVLELLIDDRGRPKWGTWTLRGQARVGEGAGQLQRVVYDLDLTFARVGAKITIERP
jgi:hypothetical protein